jgi:hypothetical protein
LIVNPRSFIASRGRLAAQAAELALRYDAEVIEARAPAQLTGELDRLRARGQRMIFVLAGDGTVQGIVQYLALLPPGQWSPALLILGGGRSNVIANDIGRPGTLRHLERALRQTRAGNPIPIREQPLLRVEQSGTGPHHGFFLAGSQIDYGIRLCHQHRSSGNGWLQRGKLSSQYCLAKLAVRVMLGQQRLPPDPMLQIVTDAGEGMAGPNRVLIVTTLEHRGQLYNPYAPRGTGAVRITAINATAARFWRRLPGILLGRFSPDMNSQSGYLSGRYERVEVLGLGSYCLDGEVYDPDPAQPVVFSSGPSLRFLQP